MSPEAHRLLKFALRYPQGWHSFSVNNPRKTRAALLSLEAHGYIEIARHKRPAQDQWRLKLGEGYRAIHASEPVVVYSENDDGTLNFLAHGGE